MYRLHLCAKKSLQRNRRVKKNWKQSLKELLLIALRFASLFMLSGHNLLDFLRRNIHKVLLLPQEAFILKHVNQRHRRLDREIVVRPAVKEWKSCWLLFFPLLKDEGLISTSCFHNPIEHSSYFLILVWLKDIDADLAIHQISLNLLVTLSVNRRDHEKILSPEGIIIRHTRKSSEMDHQEKSFIWQTSSGFTSCRSTIETSRSSSRSWDSSFSHDDLFRHPRSMKEAKQRDRQWHIICKGKFLILCHDRLYLCLKDIIVNDGDVHSRVIMIPRNTV